MFELTKECDEHPNKFINLNSEEFSKEILLANDNYLREFFSELSNEYKIQSIGDFRRGRKRLFQGLDSLSTAFYIISKERNYGCGGEGNFLNLDPEESARAFGFTNYFYQRECFRLIKNEMPRNFDSVLKSIDLVCNACEGKLKNNFE